MKYKKDDRVKLEKGIFDDGHHIEAGTLGTVIEARNGKVLVQFKTTPRACGLVLLDQQQQQLVVL